MRCFLALSLVAWAAVGAAETTYSAPESAALGCIVYNKHCDACHGKCGKGDGAAAYCLTKRPSNLTDADYALYSDEEYLEVIAKGQRTMPRFDKMLTPKECMQVIAYLKTLIVSK